jgi:MFS family permease
MLAMFVSCLDRGTISLLVEPIKRQYHLSDTQFGALQSFAFGSFYVTMAIPLGWLADRYQRRLVIVAGIVVFDFFAILTGLAGSYAQLFLARVGVGFGEASVTPAAFSMLSDYFPHQRLGRALSLFTVSSYVGSASALVAGGALLTSFDKLYAIRSDALFGLLPWQATVISIALPGLVLLPLFLLLREPARRGVAETDARGGASESVWKQHGSRRTVILLLIAGSAMASTLTQAVSLWLPGLFIRVYGWSAAEIGLAMGALLLGGGIVGALLGGWLTDRMTARGKPAAPIAFAAWSYGVVGLCGVIAPVLPAGSQALLCFVPVFILAPLPFGIVPAALQLILPNQLRARVSAAYLTVINLVGLAFGPIVVGMMTDNLFRSPAGVRYSIAVLTAITAPLMILLMTLSCRPYACLRQQIAGSV